MSRTSDGDRYAPRRIRVALRAIWMSAASAFTLFALVCAGAAPAVAAAADGYRPVTVLKSWANDGLSVPLGVGTNAAGHVFVVDANFAVARYRVVEFDASGNHVRSFGETGHGAGQLDRPFGLAVNQQSGHVLVLEAGNRRVSEFDSSGEFVRALGWGVSDGTEQFQICTTVCQRGISGAGAGQFGEAFATPGIDPENGELYVPDSTNNRVQVFDVSGSFSRVITGSGENALNQPVAVAVGPGGKVFVEDVGGGTRVELFDRAGAFVSAFGEGLLGPAGFLAGLAVNPSTGGLFVSGFEQSVELDATGTSVVSTLHGASGPIAFDAQSGRLYAAELHTNAAVMILERGPLPDVTSEPATAVQFNGATLNATINPQGNATTYQFEYGIDTTYGSRAPATDAEVGADTADHPVSQEITGLQPTTTYHYRVVASVLGVPVAMSDDATFTTSEVPGSASTGDATELSPGGATLSATVNPGGYSTQYSFEYGVDTNYGSRLPAAEVGSDFDDHVVSARVTGLSGSTTYHYRVVAINGGVEIYGEDRTFTTTAPAVRLTAGSVDDITHESATVSVTINPMGFSTQYFFEFGTGPGYGSRAPATNVDLGSDSRDHLVELELSALAPSRIYYYRAVAISDGVRVNGPAGTFTTRPQPATALTGTAANVTSTSATLKGRVESHGRAARYHFEYWTSGPATVTPFPDAAAGAATVPRSVSVDINELKPDTRYHYRLVAVGEGGIHHGEERTFRTSARPTPPPMPPEAGAHPPGRVLLPAEAIATGRIARLKLECAGPDGSLCAGKVTLEARLSAKRRVDGSVRTVRRRVPIGAVTFSARAGSRLVVRIWLSDRARRALRSHRPLRVRASVAQAAPGAPSAERVVTLRRRRG